MPSLEALFSKHVLGLPINTPTKRPVALSVFDSYAELSATVFISQTNRSSAISTGRVVLTRKGISPFPQHIDENVAKVGRSHQCPNIVITAFAMTGAMRE